MSNLLVKYPTIWNMKKFIFSISIMSLIFNLIYYLFFKYFHINAFFGLIILLGFFYVINIKDKEKELTINDFDIFDKININPFKEYLIVLVLYVSFFITTFISIYQVNKDVPITYDEIKIELLKYKKESNATSPIEQNKTIKKIAPINEISFLKSIENSVEESAKKTELYIEKKILSIKINKKSKNLLNARVLKNHYFQYIIAIFIIFTPLFFVLSNTKNKGYYYNSIISNLWFFPLSIVLFILYEIIDIQKYITYVENYKYILIFTAIFLLLSFIGHYNILTKNEFQLKIKYTGIHGFLIAIFLLFLVFNFAFKINIVLSTVILVILGFILIGKAKEMDVYEDLQPKDI